LTQVIAQPPLPWRHSFTSLHSTPSPVKPTLQVHVYEPVSVAAQVALAGWQLHSFTLAQVRPLPVKPALHAQVKEPVVSVHAALM
jgi:hypothetical protein